jgi:hypothetical protein
MSSAPAGFAMRLHFFSLLATPAQLVEHVEAERVFQIAASSSSCCDLLVWFLALFGTVASRVA